MKIQNLLYYTLIIFLSGCTQYHQAESMSDRLPLIYPDYTDVTFPINIAPPNFRIQEEGEAFQTELGCGEENYDILIQDDEPIVRIPESEWKVLLEKAAGKKIYVRITIKQHGKWVRYSDIQDSISVHAIDPFLAYRLLYPGYELWNEMGIYQRDLTTYEQTPIAENRNFGKQCINCHTFNRNSPDTMMVHVRGKQGGTLISLNGEMEKVDPKPEEYRHGATYPAWHPSGRYIAFSANEIQQFFHSSGQKPIEVSDLAADLMIYDVQTHETFTDSLVYGEQYMETFPTWSPDGKQIYFCRAEGYRQGMSLDSIRYDPESDLYLLNLATGNIRNIAEINSDNVDSFHTWSSTGRWLVFSSKRLDGLWARPFFAHFDPETGHFSKPFLLPQKEPDFYDTFTYTYNLPELIKAPVKTGKKLLETIEEPIHRAKVKN